MHADVQIVILRLVNIDLHYSAACEIVLITYKIPARSVLPSRLAPGLQA